ncbi:MAG: polysaccharide deacetylase family protein [Erysipelotrichaceae bacterium]
MAKRMGRNAVVAIVVVLVGWQLFSLLCTPIPQSKAPLIEEGAHCVALNYHRVTPASFSKKLLTFVTQSKELTTYDVDQAVFEAQLDELLEAGAYFATPLDLADFAQSGNYPDKCVWISFDDGDQSVYEYAFPLLQERNIPFTLFVISKHVGSNDFQNLKLASWSQLRTMVESGLATIGSHTHDFHYLVEDEAVLLQAQYVKDFQRDIVQSKAILEQQLGVVVNTLAYPFGNANETIQEIVALAGYTQSFELAPYPIDARTHPLAQPRYLVSKHLFEASIRPWLAKQPS